MITFKFCPLISAFKLKIPDDVNVNVVGVRPCFRIFAPLAMVRAPLPACVQLPRLGQTLPFTAILTLLLASASEMTLAADASMMRSIGSKNHKPERPFAALVSTTIFGATFTVPLELVSTNPPLPLIAPPFAFSVPATVVFTCDQIAIDPALPFCVAETSITAPSFTVTVFAICFEFAACIALLTTTA